jgi:hypothetical protein
MSRSITGNTTVEITINELKDIVAQAAERSAEQAVEAVLARRPRPVMVTITQAAEMLGLSRPTTSNLVKCGALPLNELGRVPIEAVDRLIVTRASEQSRRRSGCST